jgi:hypothetical protein
MTENRSTRDDLPPEEHVSTVKYLPHVEGPPQEFINGLDYDLEYGGEGGEGQTHRVGDGTQS